MAQNNLTQDDVRGVLNLLENGQQQDAKEAFCKIYHKLYDNDIYDAVGHLTREIHEAIYNFVQDERLEQIAGVEMPDASERLSKIIKLTDEAANKTLDAVDECKPIASSLNKSLCDLIPFWQRLMCRNIKKEEFVSLCHQVDSMLNDTKEYSNILLNKLDVILMAQDYQDLTGQMINNVIKLVSEIENKLLDFLILIGKTPINNNNDVSLKADISPQGPALERQKQHKVVATSQDEVDDLLASLGF